MSLRLAGQDLKSIQVTTPAHPTLGASPASIKLSALTTYEASGIALLHHAPRCQTACLQTALDATAFGVSPGRPAAPRALDVFVGEPVAGEDFFAGVTDVPAFPPSFPEPLPFLPKLPLRKVLRFG
jgi:hypothetical protein